MSSISMMIGYFWGKFFRPSLDLADEIDVTGKVVVITGSNSGIGEAAALEMAKRGATVVFACRDMAKAQKVVEKIQGIAPNSTLVLVELDLGDLSSVRKCAKQIQEKFDRIDVLIDNAGIFYQDDKIHNTTDGLEAHMGINHLGHFLLTMLLLDLLKKAESSRVVVTASTGYLYAELDLDDLMLKKRGAFGMQWMGPYCNSKLANMYFAKTLAKKLEGTGVKSYAICPGYVATEIFRHDEGWFKCFIRKMTLLTSFSPEQGAETILYCALSKKCESESGKMYRFNQQWVNVMDTLNDEIGDKLWELSEKAVRL